MSDITHVISWLPPYLIGKGWDRGYWQLFTADDFDNGACDGICDGLDAPRDEDPAELADWGAEMLGFPVAIEASESTIRPGRRFGRPRREPIYLVRRAS